MEPIQRLIAIEEIRDLKARYFRLQDNKLWDEYAGLFLDNSVFDVSEAFTDPLTGQAKIPAGRQDPIIGRDAIVDYVSSGLNNQVRSFHEGFTEEVEILSENEACAVWPMEDRIWFQDGPISEMRGFGYYHETYTRQSGRWYIQTLKITRIKLNILSRKDVL